MPLVGRILEPTGGQPPDDDTSAAANARWNSWDKLYGGGPIEDVTMERASEQHGGTSTDEETTIDGGCEFAQSSRLRCSTGYAQHPTVTIVHTPSSREYRCAPWPR